MIVDIELADTGVPRSADSHAGPARTSRRPVRSEARPRGEAGRAFERPPTERSDATRRDQQPPSGLPVALLETARVPLLSIGLCRRPAARSGRTEGPNGGVSDGRSGETADPTEAVTESTQQRPRPGQYRARAEPRWPILLAVLVSIALQFALPNRHVLSPSFLFPAVEVVLLLAFVCGIRAAITRGRACDVGSPWRRDSHDH